MGYKRQAGNGVPTRMAEVALSLGLMGEDYKADGNSVPVTKSDFVRTLPLADARTKESDDDLSIRPIRKNGIVCDHLLPYQEDVMCRLLRVKERRDVYRTGVVRSLK